MNKHLLTIEKDVESHRPYPIYFRTFVTLLNEFGTKHDKESHYSTLDFHRIYCTGVHHHIFFYSERLDRLYASRRRPGKS